MVTTNMLTCHKESNLTSMANPTLPCTNCPVYGDPGRNYQASPTHLKPHPEVQLDSVIVTVEASWGALLPLSIPVHDLLQVAAPQSSSMMSALPPPLLIWTGISLMSAICCCQSRLAQSQRTAHTLFIQNFQLGNPEQSSCPQR